LGLEFAFDLVEKPAEVGAYDLPFKWFGNGFVVCLKGQDAQFEFSEIGEVVWSEKLSLKDREINLDLVQPTGVNGRIHENGIGLPLAKTAESGPAAVRRSVVGDPENAPSRTIGFPGRVRLVPVVRQTRPPAAPDVFAPGCRFSRRC